MYSVLSSVEMRHHDDEDVHDRQGDEPWLEQICKYACMYKYGLQYTRREQLVEKLGKLASLGFGT